MELIVLGKSQQTSGSFNFFAVVLVAKYLPLGQRYVGLWVRFHLPTANTRENKINIKDPTSSIQVLVLHGNLYLSPTATLRLFFHFAHTLTHSVCF